jgi:hypothetical protein
MHIAAAHPLRKWPFLCFIGYNDPQLEETMSIAVMVRPRATPRSRMLRPAFRLKFTNRQPA